MAKMLVTPQEFDLMVEIYDKLTQLGVQAGTTAMVTASDISKYEWAFSTVEKMIRRGALQYCSTTGTYHLHPTIPQPPSAFFTHALIQ